MNKFVTFTRGRRKTFGVITPGGISTADPGSHRIYAEVIHHSGIKPTHSLVERSKLTEISAEEFKQYIRSSGDTSMLEYLETTEIEEIVWHTDPNDLPTVGKYCLIFTQPQGGFGPEGRATFTGENWRMFDGFRLNKNLVRAWAYEPKGPKN